MQPYRPCDQNVWEDRCSDELTRARVDQLTERLTKRVRASPLVEGVPPEEVPRVRWRDHANPDPALDQGPCIHWDDCANHYLGSTTARSSSTMQRLHNLLKTREYDAFRDELAQAEMTREISEFYVLNSQAILAVMEGSEFASEYLEMAEAVASSPYEFAVIAENRAAYDLLQGNPLAAAEHCLATLEHVYQTEGLWNNLLIALYRLGEVATIDATLRSFMQLNDECATRLVGVLASEPDLREVRVRPAFKELLNKRS